MSVDPVSTPTRVDFYLVEGPPERVAEMACKLTEKAYLSGLRIFMRVSDAQQAEGLDQALWTFRDDSFVPHGLAGKPGSGDLAVVIGDGEASAARDVLINLSPHREPAPERFARIAELFSGSDEGAREQARERYRYYRERGFELHNHKL